MIRLVAAGALCLSLGGCALAVAGAGSGIAGYVAGKLTDPGTDVALANKTMQLDAPLKADWCRAYPEQLANDPAMAVYCAHIPTDIFGGIVTWGLVVEAWKAKK